MNYFNFTLWILEHLVGYGRLGKFISGIRQKQLNSYLRQLEQKKAIEPVPCLELTSEDYDRIASSLEKNIPFIIRNGLNEHPLWKNLNFKRIKSDFGHFKQQTFRKDYADNIPLYIPISEIVDSIEKRQNDRTILFGDLFQNQPEIAQEIYKSPVFKHDHYKKGIRKFLELFVSSKDSLTKLHLEACDAFSMQFEGSKKWTIFFPYESEKLHPRVMRSSYIVADNAFNPIHTQNYTSSMKRVEVQVNAGDILYVPGYYWHFVETVEDSLSVSCRWTKLSQQIKHPILLFALLTSTKPFIFENSHNDINNFPS